MRGAGVDVEARGPTGRGGKARVYQQLRLAASSCCVHLAEECINVCVQDEPWAAVHRRLPCGRTFRDHDTFTAFWSQLRLGSIFL